MDTLPFISRDDELARLLRLLGQAEQGTPSTLVIRGEAGVGKSRLLREFTARARGSGAQVLSGVCVALGTVVLPYVPLIEALRRLVREIGRDRVRELAGSAYAELAALASHALDPDEPAPVPGRGAQSEVFGAVLRLLDGLGADRPVVFVIEDLQWADPSTLDLVSYLARTQTTQRLLLVVTYRTTDLAPGHPLRITLAELDLHGQIHRMEVLRFNRRELRALLREATGTDVPHHLLERAFELTEGNAFFTEELLAAGVLTLDARDDEVALPRSVRDVVLARFEQLGDDAQEGMRVAATAERRVSHRLLAAVCEMSARQLRDALRECVGSQMLVTEPADRTYLFRHALQREVIHRHLLPGEREYLHRAIALALEADNDLSYAQGLTVAAELAYHWLEAGDLPQALAAAVRAGNDAVRILAYREALRQYDRALGIWHRVPDPEHTAKVSEHALLLSAADAARWAGRIEQAVELTRAALSKVDSSGDPAQAGEVYERLGQYLWEAADHGASDRAYAEAALCLADAPPSPVKARVLAVQAGRLVQVGHFTDALRLGRQALDMAREVDARPEQGRVLNTIGLALTMLGQVDEGITTLREAVDIATELGEPEGRYRAYGNLVYALDGAGRLREAVEAARTGLTRVREEGLDHTRGGTVLATNASAAMVQRGDWDEAAAMLDELTRDGQVAPSVYPRLTLAELAVARGDTDLADRLLDEVRRDGTAVRQSQFLGSLYACLAERALWRGRYADAKAAVTEGLSAIGDTDNRVAVLRLYALGLRNEADEALRRAGRSGRRRTDPAEVPAPVERLYAAVCALPDPTDARPLPELDALRLLCRAERDRSGATGHSPDWAGVAARWAELDRRYPQAYAWWRCAEAAAQQRDTAQAQAAARTAYGIATDLRAKPLLDELDALAAAARFTLAEPQPGTPVVPAPRTAAEEVRLTPRERQILPLICAGRTNPQIAAQLYLTDKGVSAHVSNILRKLGVTSRTQAALEARRRGLDG